MLTEIGFRLTGCSLISVPGFVNDQGPFDFTVDTGAGVSLISPRLARQLEITAAAQAVIAEVGAKGSQDTGKVMGKLMPQLKGKADGKMISEVVKELLAR